jgi:hypothetical protein
MPRMVFDADGLYLVSQNLDLVRGNHRFPPVSRPRPRLRAVGVSSLPISTNSGCSSVARSSRSAPRSRLLTAPPPMVLPTSLSSPLSLTESSLLLESLSSQSLNLQLRALCSVLEGVTVLLKGELDLVCGPSFSTAPPFPGTSEVFALQLTNHSSSPRRCGGQGDILAGCMAVAVHWASALHPSDTNTRTVLQPLTNKNCEETELSPTLRGCLLAAAVVKRASSFAFSKKGRATTSPDVLAEIGAAFASVVAESDEEEQEEGGGSAQGPREPL